MNQVPAQQIINNYLQLQETKLLIGELEIIRKQARSERWRYYLKYIGIVLLEYLAIFIFFGVLSKYDIFEGERLILLGLPWSHFRETGKNKQSQIIDQNNVVTRFFTNFLQFINKDIRFNEDGNLCDLDVDGLGLFIDDCSEKRIYNSFIYPIKNQTNSSVLEVIYVECSYIKKTKKSRLVDNGILFVFRMRDSVYKIANRIKISANDDGRFVDRSNIIELENPEFEDKFDVRSQDEIEARMVLTPNFMNRLLDYIKKNGPVDCVIEGDTFIIKKEFDVSPTSIDRDTSLECNIKGYIQLLSQIRQIYEIANTINVEYLNRKL